MNLRSGAAGIDPHMKRDPETSSRVGSNTRSAINRLRLNHLRLLELLVEHGTVRRAAEELDLSQPAVSQMLKDLELAFGGALFSRTRNRLTVTSLPSSKWRVRAPRSWI
jgi:DNA-binding MarR family transcriptional regulator